MDLKASNLVSPRVLEFLRHAYRFLNLDWPHASREPIPDQGFEETFRSACVTKLPAWTISQIREMHLGQDLLTASGTSHEVDVVGSCDQATAILELKHWESGTPTKNEVVVFFAKIFDYLATNPQLVLREVCPIFVSLSGFEESGLAACLGLGIHPIGPQLRPLPIIVDAAQRMDAELQASPGIYTELSDELADLWAMIYSLSTALMATWIGNRCGYLSENTILLTAASCSDSISLSRNLRDANALCLKLLTRFRANKATSQK